MERKLRGLDVSALDDLDGDTNLNQGCVHREDTYKTHVIASGQRKLQCSGEQSRTQPGQWKEVLVLQEKLGEGWL